MYLQQLLVTNFFAKFRLFLGLISGWKNIEKNSALFHADSLHVENVRKYLVNLSVVLVVVFSVVFAGQFIVFLEGFRETQKKKHEEIH